ncbi:hypothetical protein COL5a_004065 [Colletotrichum fioriniae]|nr:uncharacterized protein COL516b_000143 [Colletotrichum fioriniae]KAJ0313213.1 hypothetical protein COL516b_000143 [Colletotrichum fioriniae]KAJ0329504.1 hypothetical protein COL5a_004065 [Colletotrichum fioriniae]
MADSNPTPPEAAPKAPTPTAATTTTTTTATATSAAEGYKAAKPNPVWQMMGLRGPPKRLPSRNWLIFLSLTGAISSAIIYDKREKKRATARWAAAVSPLASEPVTDPSQLPRKLTVILASPPGDGLRVAQDHFIEYVKPILAASGLDWEFVQGRQQGDVRAAVAEKIRRRRSREERPEVELLPTEENIRDAIRAKNNTPEFEGPGGDIVIGRHAWKEYIRGLHEGWLGPLDPPPKPEVVSTPEPTTSEAASDAPSTETEGGAVEAEKKEEDKPKEEEKKSDRPRQPVPYNTTADYSASHLPSTLPAEFSPSEPVQFPHLLGFAGTFTRMGRFFNRRQLADDVGRQVAAACFAHAREYRDAEPETAAAEDSAPTPYEQQRALAHEERDWVKSVWKPVDEATADEEEKTKERIWASPMVIDPRIAQRMRRFEVRAEDEERAKAIVIPETQIEGWIKGTLRSLGTWGWSVVKGEERKGPNVGNIDDE